MANSIPARVRPALLKWARDSAGFSIEQAAEALSISIDTLTTWEDVRSLAVPSVSQLRRLAERYKRPLAVFYLPNVPRTFMPIKDFRRPHDAKEKPFSPALTHEIRTAQQRRELTLDLLSDLDYTPRKFTFSLHLEDELEVAGERVRTHILESRKARRPGRTTKAERDVFNGWRRSIEGLDVLVFQTTQVSTEEASGFAVGATTLPVIVVNQKDSLVRRTFSLLHEFVHLTLAASGVSNLDQIGSGNASKVEIFCSAVAAAALMPAISFLADPVVTNHGANRRWDDEEISAISARYGVSREATLRRLLTLRRTTVDFYQEKRSEYEKQRREFRESERLKRAQSKVKIVIPRNMPQETLSLFGRRFVEAVLDNYSSDRLTLSEVSGYLGLKTKHIPKLQRKVDATA